MPTSKQLSSVNRSAAALDAAIPASSPTIASAIAKRIRRAAGTTAHAAGHGSRHVRPRQDLLRHCKCHELGHTNRLVGTLALDGRLDRHTRAHGDLFHSDNPESATDPASRGDRRRKAHLVDSVVHDHPVGRWKHLVQHRHAERERQEAVSDGRAERPRRCALRVGVDPLGVIGRRRKRIDPLLRHVEPRGRPELDTDKVFEHAHPAIRPPARMRASDVSLPRSSRLSYRPG